MIGKALIILLVIALAIVGAIAQAQFYNIPVERAVGVMIASLILLGGIQLYVIIDERRKKKRKVK